MSGNFPKSRIRSWDDVIFDHAQFVKDMKELADHYKGKKRLTLRRFRVVRKATIFTPAQIVKIREDRQLSSLLFAKVLDVPAITVRKWESGERKPSGPALRLLEIMQQLQPESPLLLSEL